MAPENGRKNLGLAEQVLTEPFRFDFFQAVRVLERLARERTQTDSRWPSASVGQDHGPEEEVVRFRALPALSFPPAAIQRINQPRPQGSQGTYPPLEMIVSFFGLTGPQGVLPQHYTRLVVRRLRAKDAALRDFLDLFNHRLISFFFRAWEKSRLPFIYERCRLDNEEVEADRFRQGLFCLAGLGTKGLRSRLIIHDESFLYFLGHFAHSPRTASGLQAILCEYFQLQVRVLQAQGQWLALEPADQSLLPSALEPDGRNCQLGVNLIAGERVWDIQGRFRLQMGPLSYAEFCRFLPSGYALKSLAQLTRMYVGPELDFDVQIILKGEEVPWCQLAGDGPSQPFLGWTTWARTHPFEKDVNSAVFFVEETAPAR